ncbi:glycoside hydrolase family 18 protein [Bacillus sp. ISL-35]|uniref:glycoside hydrolase family 18 protein n=1 Tax=Bacillus sp. ISL-35 TaxID=2819122 RepID=UPI001BE71572|nr:glycoside hydrolase family 18 protein [Bacillus sp. ISL-35]MBT2679531.1 glycoside hydrolase family 18 protein [Bacillus sp. ISL-35]MBT2703434.1 glycoside hydrolase family 18 protein [Chryseobacterium sp. ISL-80]
MRKRILPILIILLTFTGGFLTGALFANKPHNDEAGSSTPASLSAKSSPLKKVPEKRQDSKVLIGYVQDFRNPAEIDYQSLTHVIFSFAHPTADGMILLNGDQAIKNLRAIVDNARKHDTKVILAIGGWYHINGGESYDYFKAAISNSASRKKLVHELVSIAERENLDGIDIDFEHPRSADDAQYLAEFSKELSEQLQPMGKELSIAVNAKVHSVTGTEIHSVVFEPEMFKYFDHVNLMAYDGQWDGEYNAANLSPFSYSANIVNYWTSLFDSHGFSREKLVLGVPLYAQPEDPSAKQISYESLLGHALENAGKDRVNINGTTYHYNGHSTLKKKTELALSEQIGGMMLWEAGLDAPGNQSAAKLIANALKENQDARYYTSK